MMFTRIEWETKDIFPRVLPPIAIAAAAAVYVMTRSSTAAMALLSVAMLCAALLMGARASTGLLLLVMPIQWLAITLLQFSGVAQYQEISALKEVLLGLAAIWFFLHRTHRRLTLPDLLLAVALFLVLFEQIFHPDPKGLRDDWEWVLLYTLGRVLVLRPETQALWARCAVWMCAALAVLGIWEVEVLGPAPRLLLLQTSFGETKLPSAFLATGYTGLRAASTMVSPLAFSGLCVIALVLWWTYMKNPIPAALIAAGLLFTLTRSAIAAGVICIAAIALRRREHGRIALYGLAVAACIAAAIPALDLGHFLHATFNAGADTSTIGHATSVATGVRTMLENPLGLGAGTIGPHVVIANPDALNVESSYLTLAVEYGVLAGCLYLAFIAVCLRTLFRLREPIGYAASSILLGYALLLAVGPIHLDIPLACWVWVPVGMAMTRASLSPALHQRDTEI